MLLCSSIQIGPTLIPIVADTTTAGLCLASIDYLAKASPWTATPLRYRPRRHRWFTSASRKRWFTTIALCLATLIAATNLLNMAIPTDGDPGQAPAAGSGSLYRLYPIGYRKSPGNLALVLLANTPQILLSFLYFAYDGLFTFMLLADDCSGFDVERKGLRVSTPSNRQRSTYRLQLPYRYGVPLLIVSAVLHWLVSQSFYVAILEAYEHEGNFAFDVIQSGGYSRRALLTTIVVGTIALACGVASGFRRYRPGIPFVGSCSAAISAAC